MTEMEKTAANNYKKALELVLLNSCPNSVACIFCEMHEICKQARSLYYDVLEKLGEAGVSE